MGDQDARLIAKSLQGNEKAFADLVSRHQALVYAAARAVLGDSDEVDDVVQEAFIKVYRSLSSFRGDAKFSSWLYRIARNEAINAGKRRRLTGPSIDDVEIAAPASMNADAHYEQDSRQRQLGAYLAQLDENYRMVLEMRYMGEKSYADIGEAMDLPVGTVKSYVHRGKLELKRLMEKRTLDGARKDLREEA